MVTIVRFLKFIHPALFAYWLVSKFINISENHLAGALYEMSSLLFVVLTIAVPVFIIVYWFKNKAILNKKDNIRLSLDLVFAIINIIMMTLDPAIFSNLAINV